VTPTAVGTKRTTTAARPAAGLLLAVLLTSCGGDGSVDVPSPSETITGSLPSPTRTPTRTPTLSPSESLSPTESPSSSEPTTEPPTSEPPTTEPPTSEPPTTSASPTVEPTEPESSPPATEETDATESEADEGVPAWLWWVAGLGLLGAALAAILLPRARRRSAWDTDLAAQQDEVTWFARELVPALQQAGSPDAVAGGWQVAAARVTRAEDKLTGLESTAPDEARGSRARSLRDAVRAARLGIEHLIVSRDPATQPRDLGVIGTQVQAALDQVDRTVAK